MAESKPLPWLYPYREDPQHTRLGLLAEQLGIDLEDHEGETPHAVGGHTASRFAQAVAVEDRDAFDQRFSIVDAV